MRAWITNFLRQWWSVVIAAACGIWWLLELVFDVIPTSKPLSAVFAILVSTAFAAARWWPLPAAVAVTVLFGLHGLIDVDSLAHGIATGVLAHATVCVFGALPRARDRIAGLVLIQAAAIYVYLRMPEELLEGFSREQATISNVVFFTIVWAAAWLIAARVRQTRELRARAARLEAERDELARRAVVEERERIARELHDVVAHSVSVMTVQAGGVRRLLGDDHPRERDALSSIEATGRQALAEMRRLVGVMRSDDDGPGLVPQPGLDGLERLATDMRDAGLPVDLAVTGSPIDLPSGIELSAYRIVQEALTNVLKHAGPASASVVVSHRPGELEVVVEDDGTGARGNGANGHGLIGMRERVALYGGTFEAGNRSGGGYRVHATLPVDSADRRTAGERP